MSDNREKRGQGPLPSRDPRVNGKEAPRAEAWDSDRKDANGNKFIFSDVTSLNQQNTPDGRTGGSGGGSSSST